MAEYMDISRIDDWNDLSIIDDNGNAAYVYDAGELPRADVVEREKIDKAIEEIKGQFYVLLKDETPVEELWWNKALEKTLEILKRNIGE